MCPREIKVIYNVVGNLTRLDSSQLSKGVGALEQPLRLSRLLSNCI